MSESHTRQTLIDLQLKAAGWDMHDRTRVTTELEQGFTGALNAFKRINENYSTSLTALGQLHGSLS